MLRQPICTFLGHVDHGKTSIADAIRSTAVARSEAGGITQMISSSRISLDTIQRICGKLLSAQLKLTVPGILFIDTPGHAAFSNLRKRGGNLADIAVLVVDINEGFMPQTLESIEILKQYRTPFVLALNKIDLIQGWQSKNIPLLSLIEGQQEHVRTKLDTRLYDIVGKTYEAGFNSDRFDRISDYTQQVAIIPCSAKTKEGIPELLMVLIGLAQKFLEKNLVVESDALGKGTVLEVKDEKGIGTVLDVIVYDGKLAVNDQIVIGGLDHAIVTKVKGLFEPEARGFKPVKEVNAAAGVMILANEIKDVVPGVPIAVARGNVEEIKNQVQEEVDEVVIETDEDGVVVKADSLGSLEAMIHLLKEKDILIKRASVGAISKKDLAEASSSQDEEYRVVLAFNLKPVDETGMKVIANNVIYKIIEDYGAYVVELKKKKEEKAFAFVTRPSKMQILPGCIFRQSNPAVVGVMVLSGKLKSDAELIKADGSKAGYLKSMQKERETVEEAEKDDEVAISLPGVTAGRQIKENDILYVDMNEENFRLLKKFKKLLSHGEVELLKEFAEIKRKQNKLWGL